MKSNEEKEIFSREDIFELEPYPENSEAYIVLLKRSGHKNNCLKIFLEKLVN